MTLSWMTFVLSWIFCVLFEVTALILGSVCMLIMANKIRNLLQISNFEYLMHLNTLAGRSYNDITQVGHFDNFHVLMRNISFALKIASFSTQFSHGFFLIILQRVWIFLILPHSEIFPRFSLQALLFILFKLRKAVNLTIKPEILLQPVGALNADRLKKFQERYSSFEDPVIPKFHYGSHYSSAGTVRFPFLHHWVL